MNLVGEAFFFYLFFFDKRISELFVRLFGFICTFGLIVEVVVFLVHSQNYASAHSVPDPLYSWYVWPAIVVCALLGRKPLTGAELDQLRKILSRRIGDNS